MSKFIKALLVFLSTQSLAYAMASPVGYWKTIDDVTGRAKAIIHIEETSNKILFGKVVKIFPQPDPIEICTACDGERHNKPILGMTILEDLKKDKKTENMWSNGKILDPRSGKIYHCNLRTIENGQKLSVRGYIGLPLFGRNQIWLRVSKSSRS